ncbi:MAG: ABC transporter permease [Gemmatimonadaceae bacterium]
MGNLLGDVRFALRSLRRRANFTVVALAILTLGVGTSTSVYSVVDGILFRPLPFREPERLTAVWQTYPNWRTEPQLARMWDRISLSIPEFRAWRQRQRSFEDVAIWGTTRFTLGEGEARERVDVVRASASMLDVLATKPFMGRFFSAEQDAVRGAPVTVLSYERWESRYARDPSVVGKLVRFDEGPYMIIGVLPRGLSLSHGEPTAPFWVPVGQDSSNARQSDNHRFAALGRLKPGVTLAAATQESAPLLDGRASTAWKHGVPRLQQWQEDITRDVRNPVLLLLATWSRCFSRRRRAIPR